MNIPANLKYTKEHEWIAIEGDVATIGITDFAQSELGDIVYVEIETVGETLSKDEVFGSVEAVKTVARGAQCFFRRLCAYPGGLVRSPQLPG